MAKIGSWAAVTIIVFLNCQMLFNKVSEWISSSENPLLISFTVVPFMLFCLVILLYITFEPLIKKHPRERVSAFHGEVKHIQFETLKPYSTIAITVDFSVSDNKAINKAIQLGGKQARYKLIHVLESTNAVMYGEETRDKEMLDDSKNLSMYQQQFREQGYDCSTELGFGSPKVVIPKLLTDADLLVMGTHGHTTFKDILFGTTVEKVRHSISIPLVLV